jgi:hypothetical protein
MSSQDLQTWASSFVKVLLGLRGSVEEQRREAPRILARLPTIERLWT